MATEERGLDHGPYLPHVPTPHEILEQIGRSSRGTARWIGHHWISLGLATVTLGTLTAGIYLATRPSFAATTTGANPVATTEPENNLTPVEAAKNDLNIVVLAVPTKEQPYIPPTETATATPPLPTAELSPTRKPTEVPTVTPTTGTSTPFPPTPTRESSPTASPTPTEAPKPTEKNPMKRYGSYFVTLPNNEGTIFIGSIPGTNNPDIILVYVIRRDPNTKRVTFAKYTTTLQNIQGASFKANREEQQGRESLFKLQAMVGNNGNTLTGTFERGLGNRLEYTFDFQASLTGTGPDNLIATLRQAKMAGEKLSQISVQNIKDDFKGIIDFDNLPPQ